MQTHRFGRKIKLPATVAIKHQIRMLMVQDIKKAELESARKNTEEGDVVDGVGCRTGHVERDGADEAAVAEVLSCPGAVMVALRSF